MLKPNCYVCISTYLFYIIFINTDNIPQTVCVLVFLFNINIIYIFYV